MKKPLLRSVATGIAPTAADTHIGTPHDHPPAPQAGIKHLPNLRGEVLRPRDCGLLLGQVPHKSESSEEVGLILLGPEMKKPREVRGLNGRVDGGQCGRTFP